MSITPQMIKYVNNFKFPYVTDLSCYEILYKIGQGTFGEVFKAKNKTTGEIVALKRILMTNEKEGFPITALREIKLLQQLKHSNITELIDIVSEKTYTHRFIFYLVFKFCHHDLAGILSTKGMTLSNTEVKTIMKQILNGLFKIHSSNIMHRDLKTANILVTQEGIVKLADFGLARPLFTNITTCYTNLVVTLWYRPPELLLGDCNYGPAVDIWSTGCIMVELHSKVPIFPGESEQHQLMLITNVCGSISPTTWPDVEALPYYKKMELPQNSPKCLRERVKKYIQEEHEYAFLESMLMLDPSKRPSAEQLLDSDYFFKPPLPLDNIKNLLTKVKKNTFEYTSKCGAHANRF